MASLLVTVAVESDMPRGEVQARTTLENLRVLPRFQSLCRDSGLRPTYLLTWPVVHSAEAEPLGRAQDEGRCEIGAHLHPWTTPPYQPEEDRLVAVSPNALPASSMEAKLTKLTEALEQRFGRRPRSYRAARFGANGATLQALERLGYAVESSVTPFLDWRGRGGPDWTGAPEAPYFPDRQNPARRGASPVLEVPVSVGWDRRLPEALGRLLARARAPRPPRSERTSPGGLPALPRLLWLHPSLTTADDMCRLADVLVERGLPCLNVILASTELSAGASSLSRTEDDAARTFDRFERFIAYAMTTLGAAPRTLSEFAAHYLNEN
jgi:hypothetical protein